MFADVVYGMTGFNPMHGSRPYYSAVSAARSLLDFGFKSMLALVEARFEEIPPSLAMRGDLGFVEGHDPLMSPAVIDGSVAHSKNEGGTVIVPRSHIVRAFAV